MTADRPGVDRVGVSTPFGVAVLVVVAGVPAVTALAPTAPTATLPTGDATVEAVADPVARCDVSKTTVEPGESVTLDASASENATRYRYDRTGDGSFGDWRDTETLTVSYSEAGTYEPRVQVTSPDDFTDTASCGTVTVESPNDPPAVELSHSPTEPAPGEQVTVTASATDGDGEVVGYEWYVDGELIVSSPDSEFGYVFEEPGEHTVEVVAEDDDGATTSATETVVVKNDPPTAEFTHSPTEPAPGETVSFESESSDPDGEIVAYEWRVDGETVDDGPTLEYTFPEAGEYAVALAVTDDDGATASAERTVTVVADNRPPTVDVSYSPKEPPAGESVGFEAEAGDEDGEVVAYEWRVDGETVGDGPTLEYAFPGPGEYAVAVTVTDDDGATASAERTVTVVADNRPPTVEISYSPREPTTGESVGFEAEAGDEDGDVVAYEWRVDGEFVGDGPALEYAFPGPGEYAVAVTVTDDDGATASAERVIEVRPTDTPTETPTETRTETRTETPTETRTETPTETRTETPTETRTETPTETRTETPTETRTETRTETPRGEVRLTAQWGYTPFDPRPGQRVMLVASGPYDPRITYRWDVGNDGSVDAKGRLATHTFSSTGTYTVRLVVVGPDRRETNTATVSVTTGSTGGGDSGLSIWVSPVDPRAGQRVTLSVDPAGSGPAETYRWDLDGDGRTDRRGRTITHAFPEGKARISVEAVGADGEVNRSSATVSPQDGPVPRPRNRSGPSLWLTPLDPRPGQRVTLVADPAVPTDEVAAYRWDLDGDGQHDAEGRTVTHAFPDDGTFSVDLTVERTNGSTASAGSTVPVGNATVETPGDTPARTPTGRTPTAGTPADGTTGRTTAGTPTDGTPTGGTTVATPTGTTPAGGTTVETPTDGTPAGGTTGGSTTTGSDGPGLGVVAALVALLGTAVLIARRAER